jgi:hypothetical protein
MTFDPNVTHVHDEYCEQRECMNVETGDWRYGLTSAERDEAWTRAQVPYSEEAQALDGDDSWDMVDIRNQLIAERTGGSHTPDSPFSAWPDVDERYIDNEREQQAGLREAMFEAARIASARAPGTGRKWDIERLPPANPADRRVVARDVLIQLRRQGWRLERL